MNNSTYEVNYQKVKGNWVVYTLFLGICLIFINKYLGIFILCLNIIFTVFYKNNRENKSAVAFNLALKYAISGDIKSAKEYLLDSIKFNNLNSEAYIFMACLLFDEKDYKNSLEYLKRGKADEKKDPSLYFAMGVCYFNEENYEKSISYLESITYEDNERFEKDRRFTLAKAYAEKEEYEKAYDILIGLEYSLEDLEGDALDYCYYLGICCYHTDRMDKAEKYINLVKEVDRDYKFIGLYLKNMKDTNI